MERVIIIVLLVLNICVIQRSQHYYNMYKTVKKELDDTAYTLSYYKLRYHYRNNNEVSSPEVLEAVKFAMQKAHPDNGGDTVRFIKYRNLYEKMKG